MSKAARAPGRNVSVGSRGREADCAEGSLCYPSQYVWGPRCFVPECRSDAECDAAPFGICALQVYEPSQAGDTGLGPLRCYYPDEYLDAVAYAQ